MATLDNLTEKAAGDAELSRGDVAEAMRALLDEAVAEEAKGDFLTALARKGETAGEIAAFALELRARAVVRRLIRRGSAGWCWTWWARARTCRTPLMFPRARFS